MIVPGSIGVRILRLRLPSAGEFIGFANGWLPESRGIPSCQSTGSCASATVDSTAAVRFRATALPPAVRADCRLKRAQCPYLGAIVFAIGATIETTTYKVVRGIGIALSSALAKIALLTYVNSRVTVSQLHTPSLSP